MVVIDRLTKYAHFVAISAHYTAHSVASIFIKEVCRHHGIPKSIISDRDRIFISSFWRQLFKELGSHLCYSTAHHPETDGQTEVTNRALEQYLRCYVLDNPKLWLKFLPWAEFSYNTSLHSAIGMTPFQALYGRTPPPVEPYTGRLQDSEELHSWFLDRDRILQELRTSLEHSRQRMQAQANKHRRDVHYSVGDLVLLKLRPYRQISVRPMAYSKLGKRFFGPFKILERVGAVAYRLDLPPYSRIHPVFHASLLKPYHPDTAQLHVPLPSDTWLNHPVFLPQCKLASRTILHNQQPMRQHLIQWSTLPPEAATWINEDELQRVFPHLDLEDKVNSPSTGEIVTTAAHEEARPNRIRKPPVWMRDFIQGSG